VARAERRGEIRLVAPGRRVNHDGGRDSAVPDQMSVWIELFYDLIFVAALLVLSVAVAHAHPSSQITWLVLVFAAVWWVWFTTTVCANRFHMLDLPHRLLLLFQMLVIVLMAMEARASVAGDSDYLAAEYGLLLLTVSLMYFRPRGEEDHTTAGTRRDWRLSMPFQLPASSWRCHSPNPRGSFCRLRSSFSW
jgi:low temperature requirement protein LtrA